MRLWSSRTRTRITNENRSGSPLPAGMSSGPLVGGFPSAARRRAIETEQSTPVACRVEPVARAQRVHLRLERRLVRRPEAGRAGVLDRPAPDRHLVAVGARTAGVHPAPHHEPAVGRRDDRVPVGIGDLGLGRDVPAGHRAHHAVRVDPAVAEVLVVAGDRGEAPARHRLAGGEVRGRRRRLRRQEVDVVGLHGEQLADLVGGQPSPGVAGGRVEQSRHPGRLAGGLRRARGGGDRDRHVPAVVRAPVQEQVGVRLLARVELGHRVDGDGVGIVRRVVVVLRLLVGRRGDHGHVVAVRVLHGLAREARVVDRAECLLDHRRAVVDRVGDRRREVVHVRHEAVADALLDEHAVRAAADAARAVVRLGARVLGLAGPVAVAHEVGRVVVVLGEVPAGDVVHVAVVVVVAPVGEGLDQVLRVEQAVAVAVAHARVARVVLHVEDAVAVLVVRPRALRPGQLTAVDEELVDQVGERLLPADPGVEHRDADVGTAGGDLPGLVHARAAHAEQLLRARVDRRLAGLARAQLPVVVEVVRELRRVVLRQEGVARERARVGAGRRFRVREVGPGDERREQHHGEREGRRREELRSCTRRRHGREEPIPAGRSRARGNRQARRGRSTLEASCFWDSSASSPSRGAHTRRGSGRKVPIEDTEGALRGAPSSEAGGRPGSGRPWHAHDQEDDGEGERRAPAPPPRRAASGRQITLGLSWPRPLN